MIAAAGGEEYPGRAAAGKRLSSLPKQRRWGPDLLLEAGIRRDSHDLESRVEEEERNQILQNEKKKMQAHIQVSVAILLRIPVWVFQVYLLSE